MRCANSLAPLALIALFLTLLASAGHRTNAQSDELRRGAPRNSNAIPFAFGNNRCRTPSGGCCSRRRDRVWRARSAASKLAAWACSEAGAIAQAGTASPAMEDISKHRVGHPARCCHIISSCFPGHGCVEKVEELEQHRVDPRTTRMFRPRSTDRLSCRIPESAGKITRMARTIQGKNTR